MANAPKWIISLAMAGSLSAPAISLTAAQTLVERAAAQTLVERAAAQTLVERGRAVARTQCTRCHVVGDFNPRGGISSTPSFQMIVNALPDWETRFTTFFARRPHPAAVEFSDAPPLSTSMATMVRIVISTDDVRAITAFAKTLKK